jgi:hypothetical protein
VGGGADSDAGGVLVADRPLGHLGLRFGLLLGLGRQGLGVALGLALLGALACLGVLGLLLRRACLTALAAAA